MPPGSFSGRRPHHRPHNSTRSQSGGVCTMRSPFFFFFRSFLFITDHSLRQHVMAMNGTWAPCFAVPFTWSQTLSPFCPQWDGIMQVSQSERLIHSRGMPQAVCLAARDHTERCFHSSTTDRMEGGERKSGPCPGSPLAWVLTIHSSRQSQRTERWPDLLPFMHIVPFGNSTSQRTHESDHARSSTSATMGQQERKKMLFDLWLAHWMHTIGVVIRLYGTFRLATYHRKERMRTTMSDCPLRTQM